MDEEPTQPLSQPFAIPTRPVEDTTGIVCLLFPLNNFARESVRALAESNPDVIFRHDATHDFGSTFRPSRTMIKADPGFKEEPDVKAEPDYEVEDNWDNEDDEEKHDVKREATYEPSEEPMLSIALRCNMPLHNRQLGFVFGRTPNASDIILGGYNEVQKKRMSGRHFRIYVQQPDILMVEDTSTNGTWVDNVFLGPPEHNAWLEFGTPIHERYRKRQINQGSEILILKGGVNKEYEIKFLVRIPRPDGQGFLKDAENVSNFDPEDASQEDTVAGPRAFLKTIPLKSQSVDVRRRNPNNWPGRRIWQLGEMIGSGSFATVQLATHRETGEIVAVKILQKKKLPDRADRGGYKKEVEILEQLKHVRYATSTHNISNYCR